MEVSSSLKSAMKSIGAAAVLGITMMVLRRRLAKRRRSSRTLASPTPMLAFMGPAGGKTTLTGDPRTGAPTFCGAQVLDTEGVLRFRDRLFNTFLFPGSTKPDNPETVSDFNLLFYRFMVPMLYTQLVFRRKHIVTNLISPQSCVLAGTFAKGLAESFGVEVVTCVTPAEVLEPRVAKRRECRAPPRGDWAFWDGHGSFAWHRQCHILLQGMASANGWGLKPFEEIQRTLNDRTNYSEEDPSNLLILDCRYPYFLLETAPEDPTSSSSSSANTQKGVSLVIEVYPFQWVQMSCDPLKATNPGLAKEPLSVRVRSIDLFLRSSFAFKPFQPSQRKDSPKRQDSNFHALTLDCASCTQYCFQNHPSNKDGSPSASLSDEEKLGLSQRSTLETEEEEYLLFHRFRCGMQYFIVESDREDQGRESGTPEGIRRTSTVHRTPVLQAAGSLPPPAEAAPLKLLESHVGRELLPRFQTLPTQRKRCVLAYYGSFAPFHKGHLEVLRLGRRAVEREGYSVLGAYVRPVGKLCAEKDCFLSWLAPFPLRCQIAHFVCAKELDWIAVDNGDCHDFISSLNERLKLTYPQEGGSDEGITVFWINGSDVRPSSIRAAAAARLCRAIIVPRDDSELEKNFDTDWLALNDGTPYSQVLVTDPPTLHLSSTTVRRSYVAGEYSAVAEDLGSSAAAALMSYAGYEAERNTNLKLRMQPTEAS
jgi:hypothetical protein